LAGILTVAALGCGGLTAVSTPTPLPTPTPAAPTAIPLTPTPTLPPTWQEVAPGIELRSMTFQPRVDASSAEAVLVRIDPTRYTFRIAYAPDNPSTVSEWQKQTGALAVINASFFQPDYQTAGLLATDGEVFGLSFDQIDAEYYGFAGMFSVTGGLPALRKLGTVPYQPGEPLEQAVQGLPMLLETGGVPVSFDLPDRVARRTVIAIDRSGGVLLISLPWSMVSLYELRDWLAGADELQLDAALNLDGGPSTGLVLQAGAWSLAFDSFSKVPSVLVIESEE
jgi:hypothetical protein